MLMNIRRDFRSLKIGKKQLHYIIFAAFSGVSLGLLATYPIKLRAADFILEPVQACVFAREAELTPAVRTAIAACLRWQPEATYSRCGGFYDPLMVEPLDTVDEVHILANKATFDNGRSELIGNVEVRQTGRIVNAQTAYVFRDAASKQVTRVELLGDVSMLEPGHLMIARKVTIDPRNKSGMAEDVLYRFNARRAGVVQPAWGQAGFIKRFSNKDYLLKKATYSTCVPTDNAWHIEADTITLDDANSTGVARNAKLLLGNYPIFYTPYLSFPTSNERKSGFLIPVIGSTNVGGLDLALPYYWNIAPNYDAILTPHIYSRRGVMMGGEFRYLTEGSSGKVNARYLPHDLAYKNFLQDNQQQYPELKNASADRWSVQFFDITQITPDLRLRINFQQVSDDYYLQDFSSNLAILTERQLAREGELTFTTDNWSFRGLLQSYQTLQPVNESFINDIYQRLPQLSAFGHYEDLPLNSNIAMLGQFDNFNWPNSLTPMPEGSRYYLNPILSFPQTQSWGFFTPSVEVVQNYYDLNHYLTYKPSLSQAQFERTIPRYHVDGGLVFEREAQFMDRAFTQTLEPRLFYLNTPYQNQSTIPVFDSAYFIFNTDQLFRTNRYSGLDRIGDANQLSYALSSRLLSDVSGAEKASFTMGQIRYFDERRVKLCQSPTGNCLDNPFVLGYLSPYNEWSPIASRAVYHFNPFWTATADYVWDGNTRSTNNANVDFHYQEDINKLVGLTYTYLVMGDITQLKTTDTTLDPLHQVTFSFAWPYNAKWSSLGAITYNISKGYEMMSLLGVQYDNCCWAVRLVGGRSFQSLSPVARPEYNNNIYLQVQLKGLGSVGNSDPSNTIRTFIPGYMDSFHN